MDVGNLLGQLAVLDIQLTRRGDDLLFDAPEEVLSGELVARLRTHKPAILRYLADDSLPPVERTGLATPIQRHMALRHDANPRPEVWNVPVRIDLSGALNEAVLIRSLEELVKRHQVLRTRFAWLGGVYVQQVLRFEQLDLVSVDLRDPTSTKDERGTVVDQWCTEIAQIPFSLLTDASMRVGLARTNRDQWTLVLVQHHILTDAVSVSTLLTDLGALYRTITRGDTPEEATEEQFIDYARRMARRAKEGALEPATAHWFELLAGARAGVRLPFPRSRPITPSGAGRLICRRLDHALRTELERTANHVSSTIFTVFVVGFTRLLSLLSGSDDVLITSSFGNRSEAAIETLPGLFANPIPLRVRFSPEETVAELLYATARQMSLALDHQELPQPLAQALDHRVVADVDGGTVAGFSMNHDVTEDLTLPGVKADILDVPIDAARTDLMVVCVEEREDLVLQVEYSTDVLDEQTVGAWLTRFENLLRSIGSKLPEPVARWTA
ncbi:condensation domain-containing protein [Amycolatopsis sp. cmx-11-12]|uniref:condensation domain-containing protein n=1 Tax=Amycolatopsis sp. cmx-11-12 TaxID=2785795 RepID=UPI0039180471